MAPLGSKRFTATTIAQLSALAAPVMAGNEINYILLHLYVFDLAMIMIISSSAKWGPRFSIE